MKPRLTQSALLQRLRDELDIHLAAKTLKGIDLRSAEVPAGKKPRYDWERAKAIILGQRSDHPVVKEALDKRFRRRMKAS